MRLKNEYGNPHKYTTKNGASFTGMVERGEVHDTLRITFLESSMEAVASHPLQSQPAWILHLVAYGKFRMATRIL